MKALVVGGTFDRENGKKSAIIQTLADELGWPVINGGNLDVLSDIDFKAIDTLIWMPNIDNEEEKIISSIKQQNPKLTLISSKRVIEKQYSEFDVIGRLLKTRSNLGIMIEKNEKGRLVFKLLDPLGNQYCASEQVSDLAQAIAARVGEIKSLTRVGSQKVGEKKTAGPGAAVDPDFIRIVRLLGDEFSRHVNAVNPERFLGNAATRDMTERTTRCCYGFPGVRDDEKYLISRRNVDKQTMSADDFVEVGQNENTVDYLGDVKPSVDAPIQVRLFNYYANVNYIVHGHVYIDGAPETHSKVPCGHVEEFNEIVALKPDANASNFCVNLKGHGCLILARDKEFLETVKFKSRPFPEM